MVDRLRLPSSHAGDEPSAVGAVTQRTDGRWSLDLRTQSAAGAGQRTVVANSCARVAEAAALILALTLDHPATVPLTPRAGAPPARSPIDVSLRLSFALDGGTLPSAAPGISGALAVVRGRLRVELGVTYLFPRRAMIAAESGGDIALLSAGLRGCAILRHGAIEPRLCGAVEGGAMTGTGVGVVSPTDGASPWWGLFGGAVLAWGVSPRLSLHLGVDAGLTLASPDFVIDNVGEVHRPSRALVRGALGAEWRF